MRDFNNLNALCKALYKEYKECKQYLNLGKCKSSCFDAQIADTTLTMLEDIMLSYYKRINCKQTFSGLFESISREMVELDFVSRMKGSIQELNDVICSNVEFDFMELHERLIENDHTIAIFSRMLHIRLLNNAV